ncbi:MAG: sulfatase/phosphatase domain-containing protein, partial [Planctomycetota bacterium]|nr:sulfatase/phosphatase domain-containing protein [Planctomycetota bacterium]
QGLVENTLVIFTSDNGAYGGVSDLRPLRAAKGYLYEGGIRVPAFIRFPGKIKGGLLSSEPVVTMDYFKTILDICGIGYESAICDGVSLVPLFEGKKIERDALYFHYPNYAFHKGNRLGAAIRRGAYKLIKNFDDGSVELYDLKFDIGEQKNIATERPVLASKLKNKLEKWLVEVKANMPTKP